MVRVLPNSMLIIIHVYGPTEANLAVIWFIFTISLNMTRRCSVILPVFRALVISHQSRTIGFWRLGTGRLGPATTESLDHLASN